MPSKDYIFHNIYGIAVKKMQFSELEYPVLS